MSNVSPGVFTKIIDLSQFVQAVPSTIGFIPALTEKGEDNVLKFIGSRADFISEFGEPNISTYGKNYGQGPYCSYNYLGESGALYFMRVLPDNATYSNMRIDSTVVYNPGPSGGDTTSVIDGTTVCNWDTHFDNTNWEVGDGNTNWNPAGEGPASWSPTDPSLEINIDDIGSWASGYRPTHAEVTIRYLGMGGSPEPTVITVQGYDGEGYTTIGTETYTFPGTTVDIPTTIALDFSAGYDISRVKVASPNNAFRIIDIRFYNCVTSGGEIIHIDSTASLGGDTTTSISITYVEGVNSQAEFATNLIVDGNTNPVCFLRPIGRGQWYNKLGIRITEVANPTLWDIYVLDIYERQSDGNDVIIESFEMSFDPLSRDGAGESLWIVDILATYSSILRAEMYVNENLDIYSAGYYESVKVFDKDIGTTTVSLTSGTITDIKQDFIDWESSLLDLPATYLVVAKDSRGIEIWGWLGASFGVDNESVSIYTESGLVNLGWNGNTADFDISTEVEYHIKKTKVSFADAFISSEPVPLRKGSDGDLLEADGSLDTDVATTLLNQAYSGIIDDSVLDSENIYFSMVFDCGYPSDVKTAISTLCQTRRDCVGIMDNGDNANVNLSLASRNNTHTFNNYFVALYEEYNKVFDSFTGQDMWVSPIYHMSYILPRNDTVAELWFAAAGFNRAAIDTIKDLRFNPRLGERDQMYLKQLNPIVKFNPGYVVWGQLTSQAKASALQDLNIVRLVLYIKRAFEDFCRFFIFEQNDEITWSLVAGQLVEFLEVIRKKRGLYNYTVEVGATEYERKTKKFHVNVTLDPTRVVEQIELNFFIV